MNQHFDPQAIARAMEALETNDWSDPKPFVYVADARTARVRLLMPGKLILKARKEPVFHRGMWVMIRPNRIPRA